MSRHALSAPDCPLEEFAQGLLELRRRAGNPSLAALAAESGYDSATLATALSAADLPPLTVTLAYVTACGGDAAGWASRWWELSTRLGRGGQAAPVEVVPEPPGLPRPRRGRVAVLVLAGLVAVGLTGALVLERNRSGAPGEPVNAPSGPPDYRAVAGPACPVDFVRQARTTGAGWREARGGAWTEDGCEDRFLYFGPGGDRSYFQWRFMLGLPAHRRCQAEVHVPAAANATEPVRYEIADRFDNIEKSIGRFDVDQAGNRGRWVDAATFPVGTAAVLIQMAGRDGVTADALRLTCFRT
jgi:hypothetical protein